VVHHQALRQAVTFRFDQFPHDPSKASAPILQMSWWGCPGGAEPVRYWRPPRRWTVQPANLEQVPRQKVSLNPPQAAPVFRDDIQADVTGDNSTQDLFHHVPISIIIGVVVTKQVERRHIFSISGEAADWLIKRLSC